MLGLKLFKFIPNTNASCPYYPLLFVLYLQSEFCIEYPLALFTKGFHARANSREFLLDTRS